MYLILTYFDTLVGPRVFYAVPASLPDQVTQLVNRLMNIDLHDKSYEVVTSGESNFSLVNYQFEIPSEWARGKREILLLSAAFENELPLHTFHFTLEEIVNKIRQNPEIFKGFYKKTLPECGNACDQIKKVVDEGYAILEHKVNQLQLVDRLFDQQPLVDNPDAGKVVQTIARVFITAIDSRVPEGAALLFDSGTMVGKYLDPLFQSVEMDPLVEELGQFWRKFSFGEIDEVMQTSDAVYFNVYDCFECSHVPNVGQTICRFDEGFLSTLLSEKLKTQYSVEELECYGTGAGHCRFVVK